MSNIVAVGSQVPLNLQLFDEDATKFPQAVIYNPAGTVLSTIDLAHIASGLYSDTSFVMPNVAFVRVQFRTFNEVGHTTLSALHATVSDVFISNLVAGSIVPLTVQLFDEDATKFPQGVVRDPADASLSTKDLTHLANGMYVNNTFLMTTDDFLTAEYRVFNEAGHTTLSALHSTAIDRFDKQTVTSAGISISGSVEVTEIT